MNDSKVPGQRAPDSAAPAVVAAAADLKGVADTLVVVVPVVAFGLAAVAEVAVAVAGNIAAAAVAAALCLVAGPLLLARHKNTR